MLSVIIITKNEAQHIGRCLDSIRWADEIIVLDSGSTDNTVELCMAYTDKVFVTDWPGFGLQKQRALDKATGDWVLSIDADEQVTAELRIEIEQAMQNNQFDGFEIPRLSSYCGRAMKHGGWWPDYVLRLFKREKGHFSPELVHERIYVDGKIAKLTEPLLHEAFVNPEEVLHKVNSYSTLGAQKLYEAGKQASLSQAILKGLWTFIRTYILQLGFLDGRQGLMLAISNAEGAYYKYLKLLELNNARDKERC
jgi:glycosyltransferase involved in cell wall biosynthesis